MAVSVTFPVGTTVPESVGVMTGSVVKVPVPDGAVVVTDGSTVVSFPPGNGVGVITGGRVGVVTGSVWLPEGTSVVTGGTVVSVGVTTAVVVGVMVSPGVVTVGVESLGVAVGGVTVVSVPFVTGGGSRVPVGVTTGVTEVGGSVVVGSVEVGGMSVGTMLDKMLEMTDSRGVDGVGVVSDDAVDVGTTTVLEPVPSAIVVDDRTELRAEVIGSRSEVMSRMPEEEDGTTVVCEDAGSLVAGVDEGVEVALGAWVVASVVGCTEVNEVGSAEVTAVDDTSVVDDPGAEVALVCSVDPGAVDAPGPVKVTPLLVLVEISSSEDGGGAAEEDNEVVDSALDVNVPPGPGTIIPPEVLEVEVDGVLDSVGSSGVEVGSKIVEGTPPVDWLVGVVGRGNGSTVVNVVVETMVSAGELKVGVFTSEVPVRVSKMSGNEKRFVVEVDKVLGVVSTSVDSAVDDEFVKICLLTSRGK